MPNGLTDRGSIASSSSSLTFTYDDAPSYDLGPQNDSTRPSLSSTPSQSVIDVLPQSPVSAPSLNRNRARASSLANSPATPRGQFAGHVVEEEDELELDEHTFNKGSSQLGGWKMLSITDEDDGNGARNRFQALDSLEITGMVVSVIAVLGVAAIALAIVVSPRVFATSDAT